MKIEPYKTYKDSGIEWLNKVPEHWNVTAVTNITTTVSIKNYPDEELLSVYRDYGVIIKNTRDDNHNKAGQNLENYKLVEPGYLVINKMKAWQGSLGVSEFRGIVSPAYITCKTDKRIVERGYLHHLLRCRAYINEYNRLSYGVRVDQWDMRYDDFKYIPVLLPPLAEQKAIAHYLDTKTAQIDRKIGLLTQKADLYVNLKQSLINETVTRGLDKSVPMKDSKIEWIGEVPEHWELKHFKQFSTMKGRIGWQGLKHAEFIDEGPFLITGMNFKGGKINWDEVYHITNERYEQAPEIQLKENDILMTKDGTIGKLLYVDSIPTPHKASLNSHLLVFRPFRKSFYPKYLYYQLDSSAFRGYVEIAKAGTTFFGISQAAVGRYIAVIPPLAEQKAIAHYLDTKTAQIEQVIQTINTQIKKLRELRKTLINDVVTGKIKVTDDF